MEQAAELSIQVGFSVSSRNFKKAVQRNRIKRLLREGYRLEKEILEEYLVTNNKKIAFFIIYVSKELPDFLEVKEKMKGAIIKLIKQLNETA